MILKDQTNIMFPSPDRSQSLYRVYLATTGSLPKYAEFIRDLELIARGVVMESGDEDETFRHSLRALVESRPFAAFPELDDAQYVDRLLFNSALRLLPAERAALIEALATKRETRAGVLLKIVSDERFIAQENDRSLVLLHYFGYLQRNPGEPPDRDLSGFDFWIQDLGREHNPTKLSIAFRNSIEYRRGKPGR